MNDVAELVAAIGAHDVAAVRFGSLETAEALIEEGALEWVADGDGRTPLALAKSSDRSSTARSSKTTPQKPP